MIFKWKGKTYVVKKPWIIYEVPEDDGVRPLTSLDIIVKLENELKQRQERRHRIRRKALLKYMMSNLQWYGIMIDPIKNVILDHYNLVNKRNG